MNEFEQFAHELKSQPLRRVPEHWREQILRAASADTLKRERQPWWAALLWPSPKAWATLAAAWALIICFSVVTHERSGPEESRAAAQVRMAMEEKRRLQSDIEQSLLHAQTQNPSPRSAISHGEKSA